MEILKQFFANNGAILSGIGVLIVAFLGFVTSVLAQKKKELETVSAKTEAEKAQAEKLAAELKLETLKASDEVARLEMIQKATDKIDEEIILAEKKYSLMPTLKALKESDVLGKMKTWAFENGYSARDKNVLTDELVKSIIKSSIDFSKNVNQRPQDALKGV